MKKNRTISRHRIKRIAKNAIIFVSPYLIFTVLVAAAVFAVVALGAKLNDTYRYLITEPEPADECALVYPESSEREAYEKYAPEAVPDGVVYGESWATLTVPSVNIDVSVYEGDDGDVLLLGAGHCPSSAYPGDGGKIIIDGFTETLSGLEGVKPGDAVTLSTVYGDFEYEVTGTSVFDRNNLTLLMPDGDAETLAIYTPAPENTSGVRTDAFAAICVPVTGGESE